MHLTICFKALRFACNGLSEILMTSHQSIGLEDLAPVRSRVSWSAVLGGSVIALSLYFLLTLLAGAVGMSISDKTSANTLSIAAAVWAIAITVICLFAGGLVAAHLTTGENKLEAALYGIMVWAVFLVVIIWLAATGARAGFGAMIGVASVGTNAVSVAVQNTPSGDWEAVARQAGFTQQQIEDVKGRAQNAPANARAAVEDPANREKADAMAREAGKAATKVAWWTFFGTWLAMGVAALGGYVGAGPTFRFVTVQNPLQI